MAKRVVHSLDSAWTTSNVNVLSVTVDVPNSVDGTGSNRLAATDAAQASFAEWIPPVPLDLGAYDELRFWVLGTRRADGSSTAPFYLELSYTDAGDGPQEEHRWLVPVNRAGVWEQRRIGLANDRRTAIQSLRFSCPTALPFVCLVDEMLAVREEMLLDVEAELTARLGSNIALAGATNIPLSQPAAPGDTQLTLPLSPEFSAGNRISLAGGAPAPEEHSVVLAVHDTGAGTTTLDLDGADAVVQARPAGVGKVTLLVPVLPDVDHPMEDLTTLPTPAIVLTLLETREDPARTSLFTQRDSFRPRPGGVTSSVRPSPQAYFVDYQITVIAPLRRQQLFLYALSLSRLRAFGVTSLTDAFRINGAPAPLMQLPSPPLDERMTGDHSPLYVRVHTRMEVAARTETRGVLSTTIGSGQLSGPLPGSGGGGSGGSGGGGSGGPEIIELPVAPVPGPEPATPPGVDPAENESLVIVIGSG